MGQNQLLLTMLSISNPMKCVAEAVAYYLDERKENYYLNGIDKEGQWFGEGAARLGLGRTVHREEFRNLLNGLSPDGRSERVQNAAPRCGFALTLGSVLAHYRDQFKARAAFQCPQCREPLPVTAP